jgi:hypothetical protein
MFIAMNRFQVANLPFPTNCGRMGDRCIGLASHIASDRGCISQVT